MLGAEPIHAYNRAQRRRGLSPNTVRRRAYTLFAFQMWLEPRCIIDAGRGDVETWLDSLSGVDTPDLAPRARYAYLSNLGCFYRFAVREGFCVRDPTEQIERPKLSPLLPRPISDDDLDIVLRQASPRLKLAISLGAFAGLRCQEIAYLDREDVLERQSPALLYVRHGKGARERVVPLNSRIVEAMRLSGVPRRGPVVRRQDGGHLAPFTVGQMIRRHFAECGVEATAHQLRHFFATKILQRTGNMKMVQTLLGHAHLASAAIYAAWAPDQQAIDVVRNLDLDRNLERDPACNRVSRDPPPSAEASAETDAPT